MNDFYDDYNIEIARQNAKRRKNTSDENEKLKVKRR